MSTAVWPDNCPSVSCLDWATGDPNAKYFVIQLLAATVGNAAEKTIVESVVTLPNGTVTGGKFSNVSSIPSPLFAMPYSMTGKKGLLLVNKLQTVRVHGIVPLRPAPAHDVCSLCTVRVQDYVLSCSISLTHSHVLCVCMPLNIINMADIARDDRWRRRRQRLGRRGPYVRARSRGARLCAADCEINLGGRGAGLGAVRRRCGDRALFRCLRCGGLGRRGPAVRACARVQLVDPPDGPCYVEDSERRRPGRSAQRCQRLPGAGDERRRLISGLAAVRGRDGQRWLRQARAPLRHRLPARLPLGH